MCTMGTWVKLIGLECKKKIKVEENFKVVTGCCVNLRLKNGHIHIKAVSMYCVHTSKQVKRYIMVYCH